MSSTVRIVQWLIEKSRDPLLILTWWSWMNLSSFKNYQSKRFKALNEGKTEGKKDRWD
jgi:hypothetical protein